MCGKNIVLEWCNDCIDYFHLHIVGLIIEGTVAENKQGVSELSEKRKTGSKIDRAICGLKTRQKDSYPYKAEILITSFFDGVRGNSSSSSSTSWSAYSFRILAIIIAFILNFDFIRRKSQSGVNSTEDFSYHWFCCEPWSNGHRCGDYGFHCYCFNVLI